MKISYHRISLRLVIFSLFVAFVLPACSTLSQAEKAQRNAEKQERREMRQAQKEYQKALKRHKKNQDKRTKAQMKEGKKRSDKLNNSRKRSPGNKGCSHD